MSLEVVYSLEIYMSYDINLLGFTATYLWIKINTRFVYIYTFWGLSCTENWWRKNPGKEDPTWGRSRVRMIPDQKDPSEGDPGWGRAQTRRIPDEEDPRWPFVLYIIRHDGIRVGPSTSHLDRCKSHESSTLLTWLRFQSKSSTIKTAVSTSRSIIEHLVG